MIAFWHVSLFTYGHNYNYATENFLQRYSFFMKNHIPIYYILIIINCKQHTTVSKITLLYIRPHNLFLCQNGTDGRHHTTLYGFGTPVVISLK